jgi:glucose/mannose transport system substrate-binding protein
MNTTCVALMRVTLVATAAALATSVAHSDELEVLHYWTSGGEAKAAAALRAQMEAEGHTWKDFAVAGGGGDSAMTLLKSRVIAGNPPAAAQIKGPALQEWAAEGVLTTVDDVAKADNWDNVLPPVVANVMKYKGHYIAAPVNVHRVNWLWANPEVFKKANAKVPTTWDEFFVAAEAIRKAGLIPLAYGGQNWQDLLVFEDVALGVGGADFYRKAFVELDPRAINSPTMLKSLETYKRLRGYTDKSAPGRDWNLATAMVIKGEAGMQLMGDWAKGEFLAAGAIPGKDFICKPSPSTARDYTFNIDSFAMFKLTNAANAGAQKDLAKAIMSPAFQELFNLNKGSIPVRLDANLDKFDDCAKASSRDFVAASKANTLVPSVSESMAVSPAVEGALKDVIGKFWNNDTETAKQAQAEILKAAHSS